MRQEFNIKFEPQVQVKAESYLSRLGLTNFINAYYQIRDCMRFSPERVLIIGGGAGLEASIFRSWGINVTVMDIDPDLKPDIIGSVDDLSAFATHQFDVVIASHVLEHLPFHFFGQCITELSRVARHALIYLPFACIVPELKIAVEPLFRHTIRFRIPLFWKNYQFNGEHYWEIGVRGYSLSRIRSAISSQLTLFTIIIIGIGDILTILFCRANHA